jgi:hypothetical protein
MSHSQNNEVENIWSRGSHIQQLKISLCAEVIWGTNRVPRNVDKDTKYMSITNWSDKPAFMLKHTVNCFNSVYWSHENFHLYRNMEVNLPEIHIYGHGREFARTHSLVWCAIQAYSGHIFFLRRQLLVQHSRAIMSAICRVYGDEEITTNENGHHHIPNLMPPLDTTGANECPSQVLSVSRPFACVAIWSWIMC